MDYLYYPGCTLKTKAKALEDPALASLEKLGVPATPMVTIAFRELATLNAAKRGMPLARSPPHNPASSTTLTARAGAASQEDSTNPNVPLPVFLDGCLWMVRMWGLRC